MVAIVNPGYDMLSELVNASESHAAGPAFQPAAAIGFALFALWIVGCVWCLLGVVCEIQDTMRLREACCEVPEPILKTTCTALSRPMTVNPPRLLEHDGAGV